MGRAIIVDLPQTKKAQQCRSIQFFSKVRHAGYNLEQVCLASWILELQKKPNAKNLLHRITTSYPLPNLNLPPCLLVYLPRYIYIYHGQCRMFLLIWVGTVALTVFGPRSATVKAKHGVIRLDAAIIKIVVVQHTLTGSASSTRTCFKLHREASPTCDPVPLLRFCWPQ